MHFRNPLPPFSQKEFFRKPTLKGLYTPFGSPICGGQKPSLPLRKTPPLTPALFNGLYTPFGSPCRRQKPSGTNEVLEAGYGTSSGDLNTGCNLSESSFLEALFGLEFGHADFADDADFSSLLFISPTDSTEFHRFLPYAGWDFADVADDADFLCSSFQKSRRLTVSYALYVPFFETLRSTRKLPSLSCMSGMIR